LAASDSTFSVGVRMLLRPVTGALRSKTLRDCWVPAYSRSSKMNIRQATMADAAVIADFNVRLALESEQLSLEPACVSAGVAALLADQAKGIYYLAEIDGVVAGQLMITYEWSDWRNGNIWWIQSVYVREDARGQGVFRELFEYLQKLAIGQKGVCCLRLYMHSENSGARRSYERMGMKATHYEVFELEVGG
jgi:GNAT superfamily N-acetyltransferase